MDVTLEVSKCFGQAYNNTELWDWSQGRAELNYDSSYTFVILKIRSINKKFLKLGSYNH